MWEIVVSYYAATGVKYIVIQATRNGSVFDAYWSVIPPIVGVAMAVGADGAVGSRQVLLLVVFGLWGLRLTYNWALGWPGMHHEDWRYVMFKDKGIMPAPAVDATVVTGFPTMQLVLGSLPFVPALVRGDNSFGWLDVVAAVVMGGALLIETVADEQLRTFVRSDRTSGAAMAASSPERTRSTHSGGRMPSTSTAPSRVNASISVAVMGRSGSAFISGSYTMERRSSIVGNAPRNCLPW